MAKNAAAGRKSAHPNLKLMQGRSEGRDSGGRKIEPPPDFIREPPIKPEDLSEDASWMWDQIVMQMGSTGVLKPLDAYALEVICETFARWREAVRQRQESGLLASNSQGRVSAPWVGIEERAGRDFRAWCSEFGLTPAAEKNLTAESDGPGVPGGNPFV